MEKVRLRGKKLWWCIWSVGIILWIVVYSQHANGKSDTLVLTPESNPNDDTLFTMRDSSDKSTALHQATVSGSIGDDHIPSSVSDTCRKSRNGEAGRECVNVNSASIDELITLKGIGPVLAERIVLFRQNNGNFKEASDLIKVKGIGQGKLSKIKDFICF